MKKAGIYQIQNLINGKVYIGSSIDLNSRKLRHFSDLKKNKHSNSKLQNAYVKYGFENFEFSVIEYVSIKENLIKIEQFYMDTYDSVKNGYNIRIKADSSLGFPNKYKGLKRPLEIGLKISAAKMGHIVSEETRDIYRKMYAGKRVMPIGYTHDEKTRQKFAQSLKGNQNAKGHKVSDELKKYYSDLFKGEKSAKFGTHVTHCPQGHVMSGENLVIRPNGIRRCHACLLKQGAKHRAAHKARKEAKNGTQQR